MPSTTVKPEVNIPLRLSVTGAAVWPGKEWQGKQLPAQLCLKGTLPGSSDVVSVYVPAELSGVLKAAGASAREIASGPSKGMGYDLPANRKEWIVCKRQAAGEKHPHTELYEPDNQPGAVNAPPPDFTNPPKALQVPPEAMPWDGKPPVYLGERDPGEMTPLEQSFALYDECFAHAVALAKEHPGLPLEISAMASTLFIQAHKLPRGG